jgi:O-antigen/teichoic acid export membrane protein
MDTSANNKRIAKNTIVLYVRMLFLMIITLYTSRVIINALGFSDYGIYTAVGGFVAMFGILSNSLTAAISRFITFEIGHGDSTKLNNIFSTSLLIQCLIAGLAVLLMESIGIWFLNVHMTIPEERLVAANYVMQFSILTFAIQLISVPYNAAIIAHEHMGAYAAISIFNGVGTLAIAFIVRATSSLDRLTIYALLLALLALLVRFIYGIYCRKYFAECKFSLKYDKKLIKQITSFAGWNFFGASSAVLRDQGINVLLNIFCGPVVNAARGIAMQVNAAIHSLSSSFLSALSPQITKQYAKGDVSYSLNLCFKGARFSYYLLLLLGLPIFVEAEQILTLWLGNIPPHAVSFVRLIVIYALSEAISSTLITLMLATGDIKKYQIVVGGTQLLNFPVAYLLLKIGFSPESTMVSTIVIALICLLFRLILLRRMVGLSVRSFAKDVLLNVLVVTLLSAVIPVLFVMNMESGLLRLGLSLLLCVIWSSSIILWIGCVKSERKMLYNKIQSYQKKLGA